MEDTSDKRPVHLYFNRHVKSGYLEGLDYRDFTNLEYRVIICESWDELPEKSIIRKG